MKNRISYVFSAFVLSLFFVANMAQAQFTFTPTNGSWTDNTAWSNPTAGAYPGGPGFAGANATIAGPGSAVATISGVGSPNALGSLTVNIAGGSTKTLNGTGALTLNGGLVALSGVLSMNGTLTITVNGDLNLAAGTMIAVGTGTRLVLNGTINASSVGVISGVNGGTVEVGPNFNGGNLPGCVTAAAGAIGVAVPGLTLFQAPGAAAPFGIVNALVLRGSMRLAAPLSMGTTGDSLRLNAGTLTIGSGMQLVTQQTTPNRLTGSGVVQGVDPTSSFTMPAAFQGGQVPGDKFANPFSGNANFTGAGQVFLTSNLTIGVDGIFSNANAAGTPFTVNPGVTLTINSQAPAGILGAGFIKTLFGGTLVLGNNITNGIFPNPASGGTNKLATTLAPAGQEGFVRFNGNVQYNNGAFTLLAPTGSMEVNNGQMTFLAAGPINFNNLNPNSIRSVGTSGITGAANTTVFNLAAGANAGVIPGVFGDFTKNATTRPFTGALSLNSNMQLNSNLTLGDGSGIPGQDGSVSGGAAVPAKIVTIGSGRTLTIQHTIAMPLLVQYQGVDSTSQVYVPAVTGVLGGVLRGGAFGSGDPNTANASQPSPPHTNPGFGGFNGTLRTDAALAVGVEAAGQLFTNAPQNTVAALAIGPAGVFINNGGITMAAGASMVLNNQGPSSLRGGGQIQGTGAAFTAGFTGTTVPDTGATTTPVRPVSSIVYIGPGFNGGTINGTNFADPLNGAMVLQGTGINLSGRLATAAAGSLVLGITSATDLTLLPNAEYQLNVAGAAATEAAGATNIGGLGVIRANSAAARYIVNPANAGVVLGPGNSGGAVAGSLNLVQNTYPAAGVVQGAVRTSLPFNGTFAVFNAASLSNRAVLNIGTLGALQLNANLSFGGNTQPAGASISLNNTAPNSITGLGRLSGPITGVPNANNAGTITFGIGANGGIIPGININLSNSGGGVLQTQSAMTQTGNLNIGPAAPVAGSGVGVLNLGGDYTVAQNSLLSMTNVGGNAIAAPNAPPFIPIPSATSFKVQGVDITSVVSLGANPPTAATAFNGGQYDGNALANPFNGLLRLNVGVIVAPPPAVAGPTSITNNVVIGAPGGLNLATANPVSVSGGLTMNNTGANSFFGAGQLANITGATPAPASITLGAGFNGGVLPGSNFQATTVGASPGVGLVGILRTSSALTLNGSLTMNPNTGLTAGNFGIANVGASTLTLGGNLTVGGGSTLQLPGNNQNAMSGSTGVIQGVNNASVVVVPGGFSNVNRATPDFGSANTAANGLNVFNPATLLARPFNGQLQLGTATSPQSFTMTGGVLQLGSVGGTVGALALAGTSSLTVGNAVSGGLPVDSLQVLNVSPLSTVFPQVGQGINGTDRNSVIYLGPGALAGVIPTRVLAGGGDAASGSGTGVFAGPGGAAATISLGGMHGSVGPASQSLRATLVLGDPNRTNNPDFTLADHLTIGQNVAFGGGATGALHGALEVNANLRVNGRTLSNPIVLALNFTGGDPTPPFGQATAARSLLRTASGTGINGTNFISSGVARGQIFAQDNTAIVSLGIDRFDPSDTAGVKTGGTATPFNTSNASTAGSPNRPIVVGAAGSTIFDNGFIPGGMFAAPFNGRLVVPVGTARGGPTLQGTLVIGTPNPNNLSTTPGVLDLTTNSNTVSSLSIAGGEGTTTTGATLVVNGSMQANRSVTAFAVAANPNAAAAFYSTLNTPIPVANNNFHIDVRGGGGSTDGRTIASQYTNGTAGHLIFGPNANTTPVYTTPTLPVTGLGTWVGPRQGLVRGTLVTDAIGTMTLSSPTTAGSNGLSIAGSLVVGGPVYNFIPDVGNGGTYYDFDGITPGPNTNFSFSGSASRYYLQNAGMTPLQRILFNRTTTIFANNRNRTTVPFRTGSLTDASNGRLNVPAGGFLTLSIDTTSGAAVSGQLTGAGRLAGADRTATIGFNPSTNPAWTLSNPAANPISGAASGGFYGQMGTNPMLPAENFASPFVGTLALYNGVAMTMTGRLTLGNNGRIHAITNASNITLFASGRPDREVSNFGASHSSGQLVINNTNTGANGPFSFTPNNTGGFIRSAAYAVSVVAGQETNVTATGGTVVLGPGMNGGLLDQRTAGGAASPLLTTPFTGTLIVSGASVSSGIGTPIRLSGGLTIGSNAAPVGITVNATPSGALASSFLRTYEGGTTNGPGALELTGPGPSLELANVAANPFNVAAGAAGTLVLNVTNANAFRGSAAPLTFGTVGIQAGSGTAAQTANLILGNRATNRFAASAVAANLYAFNGGILPTALLGSSVVQNPALGAGTGIEQTGGGIGNNLGDMSTGSAPPAVAAALDKGTFQILTPGVTAQGTGMQMFSRMIFGDGVGTGQNAAGSLNLPANFTWVQRNTFTTLPATALGVIQGVNRTSIFQVGSSDGSGNGHPNGSNAGRIGLPAVNQIGFAAGSNNVTFGGNTGAPGTGFNGTLWFSDGAEVGNDVTSSGTNVYQLTINTPGALVVSTNTLSADATSIFNFNQTGSASFDGRIQGGSANLGSGFNGGVFSGGQFGTSNTSGYNGNLSVTTGNLTVGSFPYPVSGLYWGAFGGNLQVNTGFTFNFRGPGSTVTLGSAATTVNAFIQGGGTAILGAGGATPSYFVTPSTSGTLRLANVGNTTFPIGPTTTQYTPIQVINNGPLSTWRATVRGAATSPSRALPSTIPSTSRVLAQWDVAQETFPAVITGNTAVTFVPNWGTTGSQNAEGAGFNRTRAVTAYYSTNPANVGYVGTQPTGAITVPTPANFFSSALTVIPVANDTLGALPPSAGAAANFAGLGTANRLRFPIVVYSAPQPTITSFTPTSAGTGNAVRIIGRFFGVTSVTFGGVNASSFSLNATGDTLTAIVGAGATGSVIVNQPGGTATLAGFTYIQTLVALTGLSLVPSTVPAGLGDQEVTINGTNFGSAGLTLNVTGPTGTGRAVILSNNSGRIVARIPGSTIASPGSFTVNITSTDRLASSVAGTAVRAAAPTIDLSPTATPAAIVPSVTNASLAAFTVTINGTGLAASTVVSFNGTALRTMGFTRSTTSNATTLLVEIPASLNVFGVQNGVLLIRNTDGQSVTGSLTINSFPRPVITSLDPVAVVAGSPAFTLTINGSGFLPGATVLFAGQSLTPTITPTRITVTVPAASVASASLYAVEVRNPDQQGIGARFPATNGPVSPGTITAVTPSSTNATSPASAFTVTITGTAFPTNPTVALGMTSLRVISASATAVVVEVPASANVAGTYLLGVTDPVSNATATRTFTIGSGPSVPTPGGLTFSPASGTQNAGTAFNITVSGSNILPGATVTFGSNPPFVLTTVTSTGGTVTATVPNTFVSGNHLVTVTNPGGSPSAVQNYLINTPSGGRDTVTRTNPGGTSVRAVQPLANSRVFPNPVVDNFTVEASLEKAAQVVINVTNVLGQRVLMITQDANAGFFTKQINVSTLPAGAYMVEITDGTRRSIEQIVKQ